MASPSFEVNMQAENHTRSPAEVKCVNGQYMPAGSHQQGQQIVIPIIPASRSIRPINCPSIKRVYSLSTDMISMALRTLSLGGISKVSPEIARLFVKRVGIPNP